MTFSGTLHEIPESSSSHQMRVPVSRAIDRTAHRAFSYRARVLHVPVSPLNAADTPAQSSTYRERIEVDSACCCP
eukprot:ctg_4645.g638